MEGQKDRTHTITVNHCTSVDGPLNPEKKSEQNNLREITVSHGQQG